MIEAAKLNERRLGTIGNPTFCHAPDGRHVAAWGLEFMTETMLEVTDLYKSFGGVAAINGVSLSVEHGEVHAIIGPNGAGKTTLIAQLSGEIMPDSGRIMLQGRTITRLPMHVRCHLGLARSFQITSIFREMTVLENVQLAVQAHQGNSFRFWRAAGTDAALTRPALETVDAVGLGGRDGVRAANLSHGEQRQLEIAMALATGPRPSSRRPSHSLKTPPNSRPGPMAGDGREPSQETAAMAGHLLRSPKGEAGARVA